MTTTGTTVSATAPNADPAGPAAPRGVVWLVAEREIISRLRSKAFLVSTGILLLAVLASVLVGGIVSGIDHSTKVAVVGSAASVVDKAEGLKGVEAADTSAAEKLVREKKVDAAVVPDESAATKVKVIALDSTPSDVMQALSVYPEVQLLKPAGQNPLLIYFVALGFGIVFFMSAMTFGQTIAQSVVEEKQTRVVEILLSTISARALMTGKVLGNSIMAFAQIAVMALLTTGGLLATGQKLLLANLGSSVVWFVVFFAIGFIMIAALYAATAALVSRQEDVGSATAPVMMLVLLPYILVIIFNNNPAVLAVMSYVPFSAPVGMPMRLFLGSAAWWEPLLSLVVLLATTAVVIALGSRIYSNSLLRTGAKVKLSDALKG
ncbi:ABC transporter permease [Microbacterium sp. STN6]|uniref:ABC transporter permease n=1 Tax=Microbacterium sp. STN6 TaxID=2995588 RepID=UPI002260E9C4|nr:ABC transporter permease [Microbacterium sp. STN6]MCX7522920.1 ABC transporter permease [Microbacterium sp. STN6]